MCMRSKIIRLISTSSVLLVRQSEGELQAELDLPRRREGASNGGGRSDARARRVKELEALLKRSWPVKIRPVDHVERLGPKLKALRFLQQEVFYNRKIEVRQSRADNGVAPQVAVE